MVEITLYLLKPKILEAVEVGGRNTVEAVAKWCGGKVIRNDFNEGVEVPVIDLKMYAAIGDFVVKSDKSEVFMAVKRETFLEHHIPLEHGQISTVDGDLVS